MTRYAVMGDPIAQSKSPQIHSQFANLTKQNVAYEKLRVEAHSARVAHGLGAFEAAWRWRSVDGHESRRRRFASAVRFGRRR